jgi:hypothetical protein
MWTGEVKVKDKVVPVFNPVASPSVKEPPISTGMEAGWAPEPVWMLQSRESPAPAGNWTPANQP